MRTAVKGVERDKGGYIGPQGSRLVQKAASNPS